MLYTQCSGMCRCRNFLLPVWDVKRRKAHILFGLNVNYLVSQTFSTNILGARNTTVRDKLSGCQLLLVCKHPASAQVQSWQPLQIDGPRNIQVQQLPTMLDKSAYSIRGNVRALGQTHGFQHGTGCCQRHYASVCHSPAL
jgi:hypothetical protein